ncbi:MAG: hypothetical protein SFX74_04225 [Fimbriimonadaceae bacterium]|nr:hypothetical protein [Fimbriimonadaceae bacterium]
MVRLPHLGAWLLVLSVFFSAVVAFMPRTAEGTHCPTASVQTKSIERVERTIRGNTIVTKFIRAVTAEDEEFRQCRCEEAEIESETIDADAGGGNIAGVLTSPWQLPALAHADPPGRFAAIRSGVHFRSGPVAVPPPNA